MASEELLDYIRKALAAGQNRNDITLNLVTSGWAGGEIDEAFLQFESPHASASSSPPPFAKSNNSLPSIKILFKESWQLFKATLIPLMKLMGLVFVGGV
ncbi:MAG TPA: hypothetical protein VNA13_00250, partial [Xanthomonadales bacterium]|nr:hypothetical protein [Xanthomonadales bacterium]